MLLNGITKILIINFEPLIRSMSLSNRLIKWYHQNYRHLPWRNTRDPYQIWLSEIILQQTRVEQGLPYYQQFTELFPTIWDLARAHPDRVMKAWQGLGYYSRAKNLHLTAKIICEKHDGIFPTDYKEVRALPGIGDYTAAAICSFAFQLPHVAADGNVSRVISRLFGVNSPINSAKGKKLVQELAQELMDIRQPDIFNQALIELGALICKPASPLCHQCVLRTDCFAHQQNSVDQYPVKTKKPTVGKRYYNYLLIHSNNCIWLSPRTEAGIWAGLYNLPIIETKGMTAASRIPKLGAWRKIFRSQQVIISKVKELEIHRLTHREIQSRLFIIQPEIKAGFQLAEPFIQVPVEKVMEYPVPKPVERILNLFHTEFQSVED
jgi:A/G-specific adenine glycosylase